MKTPRDCTGSDLVKALRKLDYVVVRQSGSHIRVTTQRDGENHETIPNHVPLKTGLLHGLLKHLAQHHGMTVENLMRELDL